LYREPKYCRVGDGKKLEIKGVGSIEFMCNVNGQVKEGGLNSVLLISGISANPFSIGAAGENDIEAVFDNSGCRLIHRPSRQTVGQVRELNDKLYVMDISVARHDRSPFQVSGPESLEHYHRLLGHASADRIKTLLDEPGIKTAGKDQIVCGDCPEGKARKASHLSREAETDRPGVVHVGLSVIVNKASIQGHHSYLLAKDRFTEYVFVYFCTSKSGVPSLL